MFMLSKCESCGRWLRSSQQLCPGCGTENPFFAEEDYSVSSPRSLGELRTYCQERRLPLDRLGFDLSGEGREPCTVGIGQSENRFLVYRVGEDGRHEALVGPTTEESAVQSLLEHLKAACGKLDILLDEGGEISDQDAERWALGDLPEEEGKASSAQVWLFLLGIPFFPLLFILTVISFVLDLVPYFLYYRWLKPKDWHFSPDPGKNREALRARLSGRELGAYLRGSLRWGAQEQPNLREERFLDELWFRLLPKTLRTLLIVLLVLAILLSVAGIRHLNDGYYSDGSDLLYYRWINRWFCLPVDRTDANHWAFCGESREVPEGLERLGRSWQAEWGGTDFRKSLDYYVLKNGLFA